MSKILGLGAEGKPPAPAICALCSQAAGRDLAQLRPAVGERHRGWRLSHAGARGAGLMKKTCPSLRCSLPVRL